MRDLVSRDLEGAAYLARMEELPPEPAMTRWEAERDAAGPSLSEQWAETGWPPHECEEQGVSDDDGDHVYCGVCGVEL